MARFRAIMGYLCLFVCLVVGQGGLMAAQAQDPKVVVVILDRMGVRDWYAHQLPNFQTLIRQGAIGLMNTQTAKGASSEAAYVTLGAGTRAAATNSARLGFNIHERYQHSNAGALFQGSTAVVPETEVVHLGVGNLIEVNAALDHTVVIGALGEGLRQAGKTTAVIGNADTEDVWQRQAVTIAMDGIGRVDFGDVSARVVERNPDVIYSLVTNYEQVWAQTKLALTQADFLVIELADLARLDSFRDAFLPTVFAQRRLEALKRVDAFLGQLWARLKPEHSRLFIVSPTAPRLGAAERDTMTLMLAVGAGVKPGILTSPTTRRRGVVANIDFAPTVLDFFSSDPSPFMLGQVLESLASEDPQREIAILHQRIVNTNQNRTVLLRIFIVCQIIGMLAVILALLHAYNPERWFKSLKMYLVILVAMPLAFFVLPVLPPMGLAATIAAWLSISLLLMALFSRGKAHPLLPFLWASILTVGLILLDAATGGYFLVRSLLGYDVQAGSRYFGIGNEYMGVLLGATIIAATSFLDLRGPSLLRKFICLFVFTLVTFTLLSGNLGANAGGALSAAIGLGVTVLLIWDRKFGWRQLGYVALALVGVFALMLTLDLLRAGGPTSHIGRAANLIRVGGLAQAGMIISRKWAMNYKLIQYTFWTRVLLMAIVTLAVLLYRPVGILRQIKERYPYTSKGLVGAVVVAAAVFLLNDSGVVAAATAALFPIMTLLYLVLAELERKEI